MLHENDHRISDRTKEDADRNHTEPYERKAITVVWNTVDLYRAEHTGHDEHEREKPKRKRKNRQDRAKHVYLLAYTINIGTNAGNVNRKSACNRTFFHQ